MRKQDRLLEFARIGAKARLSAIQAEQEAIRREFPELSKAVPPSPNGAVRKHHTMSKAARKAVSVRMKRYLAQRKAGKKSAAK